MGRVRIEVEIDEVRLVGVPARERRRIVAALEREIGEALERRGESLGGGGDLVGRDVSVERIDVGATSLMGPGALRGVGERIAGRVFGDAK